MRVPSATGTTQDKNAKDTPRVRQKENTETVFYLHEIKDKLSKAKRLKL